MESLRLYSMAVGAGAVLVTAMAFMLRRKRKTDEQLERERRERINVIGRITDGTVIDAQEIPKDPEHNLQMLIYTYDVAGVQYEASQDVTHLRQFIDLHSCRVGLPASVKYDPHNPGNSIVITEQWCGIRK